MKIDAPWTQDQVDALNHWQGVGFMHPFTCPRHSDHSLTATLNGWVCEEEGCTYTQNWAHDFMFSIPNVHNRETK